MNVFFSNPLIGIASKGDTGELVALLNSAYRGEASKKGWTTEADLIAGEVRADEQSVLQAMFEPGSAFLVYRTVDGLLLGCVNLQVHRPLIYLGMFSVSPEAQGNGIGKQLLAAAEEYAIAHVCHGIYMTVISARSELINWYRRHGYADTGKRRPFAEDGLSGKHQQPLEFMVLEKKFGE